MTELLIDPAVNSDVECIEVVADPRSDSSETSHPKRDSRHTVSSSGLAGAALAEQAVHQCRSGDEHALCR
jgi:hypothetical protein